MRESGRGPESEHDPSRDSVRDPSRNRREREGERESERVGEWGKCECEQKRVGESERERERLSWGDPEQGDRGFLHRPPKGDAKRGIRNNTNVQRT